jgi:tripartite-type tricarboxylate transporter receptor subunit TctC
MNTIPAHATTRRSVLQRALASTIALVGASAHAQTFPDRPVRIVVGFPAGGTFDTVMRALAEELTGSLGVPVTIDNRAGAGGSIATQAVVSAPADGYTLLTAGLQLATGPHLIKVGYEPLTDLTMVAQVSSAPVLLLVKGDSAIQDARDLVAGASKRGKGLSIGTGGVGTTGHFGTIMLAGALNTPVVHVPFRGGAPGLLALAGGEIDAMFDQSSGAMQGLIQSGKIRVAAVMQDKRVSAYPDVRNASEFGLQLEMPLRGWQGIAVRAGTPAAVVDRLHVAVAAAVASNRFKARLDQLGMELVTGSSPDAFQKHYLAELNRWGLFIKRHQITTN